MKLLNKFRRMLRDARGYTLDQVILIIAIIAILVTIVILTVGWNIINRAGASRLSSQLTSFEAAVGQFYGETRVWPHSASTGGGDATIRTILLLTGQTPAGSTLSGVAASQLRNYLPGIRTSNAAAASISASHSLGTAGGVRMTNLTNPFGNTGTYLVVEYTNVPATEAILAEEAIDGSGSPSYSTGRFVGVAGSEASGCIDGTLTTPMTAASTGLVHVCYVANAI